MSGNAFDLDGLVMNAPVTAPGGVINHDTVFRFTQRGDLVTAEYAGGRVVRGFLVGRVEGDRLRFRYCQAHEDGGLAGGDSDCALERGEDGRVRILEHYTWSDGGTGTNVIREL